MTIFVGKGNFSLPLAREGASVRGFELSEDAVGMASINARNNGLSHRAQFFALDLYEKSPAENRSCDGLLLDPPRVGLALIFRNGSMQNPVRRSFMFLQQRIASKRF
ncbi:MAG: hypothetical protein Ct9H90mP27_6970 [Gammaproteobacteria bacterium]|nr:MAG: hypothetical protein Ct9H90mP27_6970 [Gammaproteobacteria bacterium]